MKRSKKIISLFLAALMLLSLCACGGTGGTTEGGSGDKPQTTYLSFGTGTTGGVFYTAGIGIGTLLTDKTYMNVTVEATKASAENCNLLKAGNIEIATMSFPTTLQAYLGDMAFKDNKIDVCVLFQMYANPVHMIVMKDSPYKSVEDLRGKTISVGQAGSGNYNVAVAFLEGLYGMVEGVDYKAEYLNYTESVEAFKNGTIDAALFDTVSPHATIIDLASWKPIRLLPFDASLIEQTDNVYAQNFITMTIPAGTYSGQDEDILCAAHGNYVTTSSTLDEQVGYDIVKTVMENLDYMATVHDAFKLLSLEEGCQTGGLPLHAGAQRYFEEQGLTF